jgi:hypothetical protein
MKKRKRYEKESKKHGIGNGTPYVVRFHEGRSGEKK